jgi:molecular chaperone GrpE
VIAEGSSSLALPECIQYTKQHINNHFLGWGILIMVSDNDHVTETMHADQDIADNAQQIHGQHGDTKEQQVHEQLKVCQAQLSEWKDKYLRVNADLDNVTRRAAKDRALSHYNAQVALLLPLLSIVDDFERALEQHNTGQSADSKQWVDGITMIHTSLIKYLASAGVEPMTDYDHFDPEYHEALVHVASDIHTSGQIVAVLAKGYLFKGQVLRPAKVSVAK